MVQSGRLLKNSIWLGYWWKYVLWLLLKFEAGDIAYKRMFTTNETTG